MPFQFILWVLVRILLGAYLLTGFIHYMRWAPDLESKAREEAAGKGAGLRIALRAAAAVLLWPLVLMRMRKEK